MKTILEGAQRQAGVAGVAGVAEASGPVEAARAAILNGRRDPFALASVGRPDPLAIAVKV